MPDPTHYRGKLIDEMTREELVAALKTMARLYTRHLEDRIQIFANKRKSGK